MTGHLSDEELVLFYYGEAAATDHVEQHLAGCEPCRQEYQALQRLLNTMDGAPVPERSAQYGSEVWRRIERRLPRRPRWAWELRRWALAGAMAALVIAAFLAGRFLPRGNAPAPTASGGQVRERILLVAMGDHLERSQAILLELVNGEGSDISYEQKAAEDLLDANRIYRQTALRSGDLAAANMLDDLERVLLEIARSPAGLTRRQLEQLRRQIEDRGILFKVRVFASQVEERETRNEL